MDRINEQIAVAVRAFRPVGVQPARDRGSLQQQSMDARALEAVRYLGDTAIGPKPHARGGQLLELLGPVKRHINSVRTVRRLRWTLVRCQWSVLHTLRSDDRRASPQVHV